LYFYCYTSLSFGPNERPDGRRRRRPSRQTSIHSQFSLLDALLYDVDGDGGGGGGVTKNKNETRERISY